MSKPNTPIIERFLANINYLPNGCWEWCGYINNRGVGQISVLGTDESAHRVAYKLFVGSIPIADTRVGHTCNNKLCVNPAHLILLDEQTRFWRFVDKHDPDDCWFWTGRLNACGYGCFRASNGMQLAHRYMWEQTYGEIPEGMCVCHTCDVPKCCNLKHLFLGTHTDNMQDMLKKERGNQPKGEKNCHAKLTEPEVLAIRALHEYSSYFTKHKLSELFNIGRTAMRDLLNYKTWKHI
jgi:hypothetical protein